MWNRELVAEIVKGLNTQSKRKLREDLTPEEKERLEKYGVVEFTSAGATRKR